jgi:hypothetical protein
MTTDRRLAKVEAALTPTELVLRWLAEAHAHDTFDAYTRALLDADPDEMPMDRLVREAEASARAQTRGRPREDVQRAIRRACVETLFRAQLVLQITVRTQELLDREILVHAALGAYLAAAANPPRKPPKGGPPANPVQLRDVCIARVNELHAFEEARAQVERSHLDGATALFPAAVREWDEQRKRTETLGVLAIHMCELDGTEFSPADDLEAFDARVTQIAADFVEPARSKAYNELGDGRRAMSIAFDWLRPKTVGVPESN